MNATVKRLCRSRTDKKIAGVCGGLGNYFGVDPVIPRIVLLVLFLAGGLGLLAYVICWIVMPLEPSA